MMSKGNILLQEAENTVIDYVMRDKKVREKVWSMRVEDKINSDHHPVVVWLKGEERKGRWESERKDRIKRAIWNEEGKEVFKQRIGGLEGKRGNKSRT